MYLPTTNNNSNIGEVTTKYKELLNGMDHISNDFRIESITSYGRPKDINREIENAEKLKKLEHVKIPKNIDYLKFSSLSTEAKEKLNSIRPINIGQAARISGIKPSDISILLIYLGR